MNWYNLNLNPKKRRASDCVVRAIAYAEGKHYEDIYAELALRGLRHSYMPNDKRNYEGYLKEHGWEKKTPEKGQKITVEDLAKIICHLRVTLPPDVYKNEKVLVRTRKHLTVIDFYDNNPTVVDIWDTSKERYFSCWVK